MSATEEVGNVPVIDLLPAMWATADNMVSAYELPAETAVNLLASMTGFPPASFAPFKVAQLHRMALIVTAGHAFGRPVLSMFSLRAK